VTLGLLHPGDMGHSVGASASAAGSRVLWASEGRSAATHARAEAAGLEDIGTLESLVAASDCIVSVCPPHGAVELARAVMAHGFKGRYVDGNAVSPDTAREIAGVISAGGAHPVDGGIVGPPARREGTTRLYLSGDGAEGVAQCFAGGPLEAIVISGPLGAASALKMAYAAWTKGSAALLMNVRALARAQRVDDALLAEWARSIPHLEAQSEGSMRGTARKAWRFVAEMQEIADTFAQSQLPDGFHRAAAAVYERMEQFKQADPPEPDEVLAALAKPQKR